MSICHCFHGTVAGSDFKPKGTYSTLAGLRTYTSVPPSNTEASNDVVLYLPDGFGLAMHNQRLADMYADCGYETTVVDYFEGDAHPDYLMLYTEGTDLDSCTNITAEQKEVLRGIDMSAWHKKHSPDHISSLLSQFFPEYCQKVANRTNARVHVVGHCFGGKHAFRLAQGGHDAVASVAVFHPAFWGAADLENLSKPVLVGCAETDVFTPDMVQTMIAKLPTSGAKWKFALYGATVHGFASRADLGDEWTANMFRLAFEDSVQWLKSN